MGFEIAPVFYCAVTAVTINVTLILYGVLGSDYWDAETIWFWELPL